MKNLAMTAILALSASSMFAADHKEIVPVKQASVCHNGKWTTMPLPRQTVIMLYSAFGHSDFEGMANIARNPQSGLKIAAIGRNAEGAIVNLTIANIGGCIIARISKDGDE